MSLAFSNNLQTLLAPSVSVIKGGVFLAASSGASSGVEEIILSLRGGADKKGFDKSKPLYATAKGRAVACMATGMALHYLGYAFARSITIALFTSASTGFPDSNFAYPLAMAFVSPTSLLLLMMYGRVLQSRGPRGALKISTLSCAVSLMLASAGLAVSQRSSVTLFNIPLMKFITAPLFIFRESYVQLLTSQYWSFMASVLTPDQSAKWFAPIAGLTSIASAAGGIGVRYLTERVNLAGTLSCTGFALCLSLIATEMAYSVADKNGFTPTGHIKKGGNETTKPRKEGMIVKAKALFARVPVLRALFIEILASQGLATLLNVCFVKVLAAIDDDKARAGWVGNFYALINIITMGLQFGVLPLLMQLIEPRDLWRCIPLISMSFITIQACQENPSLYVVSGSLLVMKVLEYSARRMLDEMVYVPLDFESRFVGKEIIGVFGYRLGKSLMSLSLSGLTSAFGSFSLQKLSILCDVAAFVWAKSAWDLSTLVPTRKEAQESYDAANRKF